MWYGVVFDDVVSGVEDDGGDVVFFEMFCS